MTWRQFNWQHFQRYLHTRIGDSWDLVYSDLKHKGFFPVYAHPHGYDKLPIRSFRPSGEFVLGEDDTLQFEPQQTPRREKAPVKIVISPDGKWLLYSRPGGWFKCTLKPYATSAMAAPSNLPPLNFEEAKQKGYQKLMKNAENAKVIRRQVSTKVARKIFADAKIPFPETLEPEKNE